VGIKIVGKVLGVVALAVALVGQGVVAERAEAGSIYLTGHDVLLHNGQNNYDNLILNWLRGAGTAGEIPAASYDILLVRGNVGSVGSVGAVNGTLEGFGTITQRNIVDFGGVGGGAALTAALAGIDILVIPDHTSCGGCDLNDAHADILESRAAEIASFFNAGGDIFGGSGASDLTFYNFLPPSAVASGLPIGGSSGFNCTAAGAAIGIIGSADASCPGTPSMINGFPTHNRFAGFAAAFTVFEVRGTEVISIGTRDATITEEGIVTDDGTPSVPAPAALVLLGAGLLGVGLLRRFRS